jgi:hypothetical protein
LKFFLQAPLAELIARVMDDQDDDLYEVGGGGGGRFDHRALLNSVEEASLDARRYDERDYQCKSEL